MLKKKCKIIEEKKPQFILVKQGSLNGILPKSAKKNIEYHLTSTESGTKITSVTEISSDWKNLTLWGNIAAAIIAGIFLWISTDMQNFVETAKQSFWTWLARAYGYPYMDKMIFMVNVTVWLAFFLMVTVFIEIVIVMYVYPRKDSFAQDTLQAII